MNEDFYNIPNPQTPTSSPSSPISTAQNPAVNAVNTSQAFFDFAGILSGINTFLLAWTMFYSILLMMDFFFYRVKYNDGIVDREKRGVKSIYGAFQLWVSYTIYLVIFMLYLANKSEWYGPIIGVIGFLMVPLKILVLDLKHLPIIEKHSKKILEVLGMPFVFLGEQVGKSLSPKPPAAPDKKPVGPPKK